MRITLFGRMVITTILLLSMSVASHCRTTADNLTASITGLVVDANTRAPISNANVQIEGELVGAHTDFNGAFKIDGITPGVYSFQASHVGYRAKLIDGVVVAESQKVDLEFHLDIQPVRVKGVTVSPADFGMAKDEPELAETLNYREISAMPQLGEDLFRAVTRLPGMTSNDFSARFTVRGGGFDEVLVTLDGLRIYEPFHLKDIDGGALSAVDAEAVESFELMTGGFPANYGDKMSAAIAVKSRSVPPDTKRISAGISLSNARAFSDGTFGGNRGSWLVSARRGYLDYILKLAGEDERINPKYYDAFAKVQYVLSPKHILAGHVLRAGDDLSFIGDGSEIGDTLTTSYGNSYVWMTLLSQLNPKLRAQNVISIGDVGQERHGQVYADLLERPDHIVAEEKDLRFLALTSNWSLSLSDKITLEAGAELHKLWADYDYQGLLFTYDYTVYPNGYVHVYRTFVDSTLALFAVDGSRFGSFVTGRFSISAPLMAEIGFRYDRASYTGDNLLSPRAALTCHVTRSASLRLAWGRYYQIEGIEEIAVRDGETEFQPAELAEHSIVSLEQSIFRGISARIEAYQKRYSKLRTDYRNTYYPIQPFPERSSDRMIMHLRSRYARGIELYLRNSGGRRLAWWISYAYSKTDEHVDYLETSDDHEKSNYGATIPTPQDQRHTLHVDIHYHPAPSWDLSAAYHIHTGWPYTDRTIEEWRDSDGRHLRITEQDIWAANRAPYHRCDIRVNRYFSLLKGRLLAFVEVLNVFGNKNVRSDDYYLRYNGRTYYLERETVYWLGRLPSAGITYELQF